ncbi:oxidase EvaA [Spinactinospora alkalitolerans]|uniref:Oxidase EvaA n=1 Tax=Spinactinospora alkalitolerans TaxID=687207 RepID=A0A852TN77_9ACTN|nr:NDP-hexose 2,3-dehydratase family protein [Spinactinospora alkalitolerans]NYE45419.1 oxidase EvaA [Spinactinospora alkalitolerans]
MSGLLHRPDEVRRWIAERRSADGLGVRRVPFDRMEGWRFHPDTGNLAHVSGRFFSVEGLRIRHGATEREWSRPVIVQPESGILGMLVRRDRAGEPEFLMQVKMEPGNFGLVQLSPTVQATPSNYTRVHAGRGVRHIEHFLPPRSGRVLTDALQSEQGAWFDRKSNRNIVVEAPDGVVAAPGDDHRWIPLHTLKALLREPDLVNMDSRSVLACLPLHETAERASDAGESFGASLARSLRPSDAGAPHTIGELLTRLNDVRADRWAEVRRIALGQVDGWHREADEVRHGAGRHFRIIAVTAHASGREVRRWDQPLLAPVGVGVSAFLVRRVEGVLHVLVGAHWEPGLAAGAELGPTVQCDTGDFAGLSREQRPPFLDAVLTAPEKRVRYDVVQSEEGGRFHHARSRYMIVEADAPTAAEAEADPRFSWATPGQLIGLCQSSGPVSVQARTLLACLHTLW